MQEKVPRTQKHNQPTTGIIYQGNRNSKKEANRTSGNEELTKRDEE